MNDFNNQPSDLALVAAANQGDAAAFQALYLRHRDWAIALARRFTHSEADAQDVAQDAFIYLLKKFPGFELRPNMRTVLYPVIKQPGYCGQPQTVFSCGATGRPGRAAGAAKEGTSDEGRRCQRRGVVCRRRICSATGNPLGIFPLF